MVPRSLVVLLRMLGLMLGGVGCARAQQDPSVDGGAEAGSESKDGAAALVDAAEGPTAAGFEAVTSERPDAGPDAVELYAFAVQAPIFNAPEWPAKDPTKSEDRPGVVRVGYLRKGEHTLAKAGTIASRRGRARATPAPRRNRRRERALRVRKEGPGESLLVMAMCLWAWHGFSTHVFSSGKKDTG